jgi:signal transduction histidine kinase
MTALPRAAFGWLGALAWLLVGAPIAVASQRAPTLAWWAAAFVGFGAAFGASLYLRGPRRLAALAVQVGCAVAMVLAMCDGLEGLLLCLVAFQLGREVRPRFGVPWVIGQALASSAAMAVHWTLGAALMLGPPYFGFQLLAYASAYLIERVADRRADAERVRLARELHDVAGHRLTALSLNLQVLRRTAPPALHAQLDAAHAIADDLLAEVRRTVAATRPAPAPVHALQALGARIPRPRVHVTYRDDLAIDDPARAHAVLRCVQEIVTNAARHADADNLWVEVRCRDGAYEVCARDDGRGTDHLVEGHGLAGMRARLAELGGSLRVESRAGAGTSVDARIPVP